MENTSDVSIDSLLSIEYLADIVAALSQVSGRGSLLFGELENSRRAKAEVYENTLVSLGAWIADSEQRLRDCINIFNVWKVGIAAHKISRVDDTQDDLRELLNAYGVAEPAGLVEAVRNQVEDDYRFILDTAQCSTVRDLFMRNVSDRRERDALRVEVANLRLELAKAQIASLQSASTTSSSNGNGLSILSQPPPPPPPEGIAIVGQARPYNRGNSWQQVQLLQTRDRPDGIVCLVINGSPLDPFWNCSSCTPVSFQQVEPLAPSVLKETRYCTPMQLASVLDSYHDAAISEPERYRDAARKAETVVESNYVPREANLVKAYRKFLEVCSHRREVIQKHQRVAVVFVPSFVSNFSIVDDVWGRAVETVRQELLFQEVAKDSIIAVGAHNARVFSLVTGSGYVLANNVEEVFRYLTSVTFSRSVEKIFLFLPRFDDSVVVPRYGKILRSIVDEAKASPHVLFVLLAPPYTTSGDQAHQATLREIRLFKGSLTASNVLVVGIADADGEQDSVYFLGAYPRVVSDPSLINNNGELSGNGMRQWIRLLNRYYRYLNIRYNTTQKERILRFRGTRGLVRGRRLRNAI